MQLGRRLAAQTAHAGRAHADSDVAGAERTAGVSSVRNFDAVREKAPEALRDRHGRLHHRLADHERDSAAGLAAWIAVTKAASLSWPNPARLSPDGCPRSRAGVPEKTAMTITGYLTRTVFGRYDIVNEQDQREAVRKLAVSVTGTISGTLGGSHQEAANHAY